MDPPKRSPLASVDDVEHASRGDLREQLRYELWQFKIETGWSNERIAHYLGFQGASTVSRWLNDSSPVSATCAKTLDEKGRVPTIGGTFTQLQQAYKRKQNGVGPARSRVPIKYDVFLASPMASSADQKEYERERRAAKDVKMALENYCNLSVYYAGDDLEDQEEFDSPVVAAEENFRALEAAHYFVLLVLSNVARPSSVYVEAGYALSRGLPSLYMVPDPDALPFVLRSLSEHRQTEVLPQVSVEYVKSKDRAVGLFRKQGQQIFKRLSLPSRQP